MKKKMPEHRYRASRICRALGNPTAYEIMVLLSDKTRAPVELADTLGVSMATISQVLRVLRNLDLVRYEIKWRQHLYWIKIDGIKRVMHELERLVTVIESQR